MSSPKLSSVRAAGTAANRSPRPPRRRQRLGQPTERDLELAFFALAGAKRVLPPEPRGGDIPFAPVVQVLPDAAPYAQLAAWLGRHP